MKNYKSNPSVAKSSPSKNLRNYTPSSNKRINFTERRDTKEKENVNSKTDEQEITYNMAGAPINNSNKRPSLGDTPSSSRKNIFAQSPHNFNRQPQKSNYEINPNDLLFNVNDDHKTLIAKNTKLRTLLVQASQKLNEFSQKFQQKEEEYKLEKNGILDELDKITLNYRTYAEGYKNYSKLEELHKNLKIDYQHNYNVLTSYQESLGVFMKDYIKLFKLISTFLNNRLSKNPLQFLFDIKDLIFDNLTKYKQSIDIMNFREIFEEYNELIIKYKSSKNISSHYQDQSEGMNYNNDNNSPTSKSEKDLCNLPFKPLNRNSKSPKNSIKTSNKHTILSKHQRRFSFDHATDKKLNNQTNKNNSDKSFLKNELKDVTDGINNNIDRINNNMMNSRESLNTSHVSNVFEQGEQRHINNTKEIPVNSNFNKGGVGHITNSNSRYNSHENVEPTSQFNKYMQKLMYVYENKLNTKEPRKEDFYENERILNKTEEIKLEDNIGNVEYDAKCFITNFRILVVSNKYIFDAPLCLIKTHYVKKPVFVGSNYIYVEFVSDLNLKTAVPQYLSGQAETTDFKNFRMPKYLMLKYRGKDFNIDQSYSIMKMALNAAEWNKIFKNSKDEKKEPEIKSKIDQVTGLGLQRTKNIIMTQLSEQNNIISGSFSDLQNLKDNVHQMIELSQQLKSKLSSTAKTDPSMNDEINQVLTSVGFIDPVTREISGKSYFIDLALQISDFFTSYFKKGEIGVLSLIDAYCIYNRSRGINTISPGDMKTALKYFSNIETPINVKSFKNEMIMLHTNDYCLKNLLNKITKVLERETDYVNLKQFAELTLNKNQLMSKILVEEMLDEGLLVVDESDLELRYYPNKILSFIKN